MLNLGRLKTVAFWDKNTAKSVPIQENDDRLVAGLEHIPEAASPGQ